MRFKSFMILNHHSYTLVTLSMYLMIISLSVACDDDQDRSRVELDQTVESDSTTIGDQDLNSRDMMILDGSTQTIITECNLKQAVQSSAEGFDGTLSDNEDILLSWYWPANSLNHLSLVNSTINEDTPTAEQWPELLFACQSLAPPRETASP